MRKERPRKWLTVGFVIAAAFGSLTSVHASVAKRLSLDRLVSASDVIVIGQCTALDSHYTADGQQIVTVATYSIAQTLKGAPTDRVSVVLLGGIVGDRGMMVEGGPRPDFGQNDLLFLTRTASNQLEVVGLGQGQFRIVFPEGAAYPRVARMTIGLELTGIADPRLEQTSLARLVRGVMAEVESQGGQK